MGRDQPAGGQGRDEELFRGLFWGAQAEAQLDIPSQDRGHAHIKLLNAFLANEVLTLQVFQSREGEHVGGTLAQRHGRSALLQNFLAGQDESLARRRIATILTASAGRF